MRYYHKFRIQAGPQSSAAAKQSSRVSTDVAQSFDSALRVSACTNLTEQTSETTLVGGMERVDS
jgi:hypothetical protein